MVNAEISSHLTEPIIMDFEGHAVKFINVYHQPDK